MSSEASIDSIFQALKVLQVEIRGLASKLHSTEERISRLEEATFTPSPSPNSIESSNHFNLSCTVGPTVSPSQPTKSPSVSPKAEALWIASDNEDIRREESSATPTSICQHANQSSMKPNSAAIRACDLEQQLQPIKDGIKHLAQHLSRIEDHLLQPNLHVPHLATSSRKTEESRRREIFTDEQFPTSPIIPSSCSPRLESPSESQIQKNRVDGPHAVLDHAGREDKSRDRPSIVFGQSSTLTPKKTEVPLNLKKSPFTKYADPASPFNRLRTEKMTWPPFKP